MDCLFCKVLEGVVPAKRVHEDDNFLAFLDIFPRTEGHTLIIPKKHYKNILDFDSSNSASLKDMIKDTEKLLVDKLDAKGLTIISNIGIAQEVPHVHWHLIPRYSVDDLKLSDPIECDLDLVLEKLKS